jgi:putative NADH-flavin reductase
MASKENRLKLLVLGATGKTGTELVRQGLMRGSDRLKVIEGSALSQELLTQVSNGHDAIVSLLGHKDLKRSLFVSEAASALVAAMKVNGVARLLAISSTLVAPGGSFLTNIPRAITRHALKDSAEMEKIIGRSSLDWTVVRLARLTSKADAPYRLFDNEPPNVSASVSRATVAKCMLDLVENRSYYQRIVSVCATR